MQAATLKIVFLIDKALEARKHNPIRVAVVGAGFITKGLINKVRNATPGIEVSLVVNRTLSNAEKLLTEAGVEFRVVSSALELSRCIESNTMAVTDDPKLIATCEAIECVVEATGTIEYAAHVALDAITSGKHLVMVNAELDAYIGPVLADLARSHGVVYTGADGDQPGVQMNLLRYVKGLGGTPLVAGNIKGLLDHYRTPETQASYAAQWGQTPEMVTSFADGTKISFEQAVVANATGFQVAQRGMLGFEHNAHVDSATQLFDIDMLRSHGAIVDYLLGASPSPGVFVFAEFQDSSQEIYLRYAKLGDGPLYSFYAPYHLLHLEVPNSIARAVLFEDATIAPDYGLMVDVVAVAKRDLQIGDKLDGLGGFDTFGTCENAATAKSEDLLPIAMAENCVVTKPIAKGSAITLSDVDKRSDYLADQLRAQL